MYKLSIYSPVYNQEEYIEEMLDGILMQKTDFQFQVVVTDGCSTDNTRSILKKYANKHDNIKLFFRESNSVQNVKSFQAVDSIRTKYVTICEGDDYWTDPYKLQKQVDFLDANTDYSICFHPVNVVYEDGRPSWILPEGIPSVTGFSDLMQKNYIATNSVVYRWIFTQEKASLSFPVGIISGDYYWHLLHAKKGKIKMLPDIMGVYRKHSGGIWSSLTDDERHAKWGLEEVMFFDAANRLGEFQYDKKMKKEINNIITSLIRTNSADILLKIAEKYPSYITNFLLKQKRLYDSISLLK